MSDMSDKNGDNNKYNSDEINDNSRQGRTDNNAGRPQQHPWNVDAFTLPNPCNASPIALAAIRHTNICWKMILYHFLKCERKITVKIFWKKI